MRAYRYKTHLAGTTHRNLAEFPDQQRQFHNATLQERVDCYHKTGETIHFHGQYPLLTEIRFFDPDCAKFHAGMQCSALNRLHKSYQWFFQHGGFPWFISKGRGIRSFDVAVKHRAVLSDGACISKHEHNHLWRRRLQRKLSRCVKGSNNRTEVKRSLAWHATDSMSATKYPSSAPAHEGHREKSRKVNRGRGCADQASNEVFPRDGGATR